MAEDPTNDGHRPRADAVRNRDKMLDAAAVTLARNAEASLADIADAAGLSRATAYRHFPDIEAVRAALLEEAGQVGRVFLQDQLAPILADPNGGLTPDQLLEILRAALPLQHRWTTAISNEPIPDDGLIKTFAPMCKALLRRGQLRGEFRSDLDSEVTSEAIIALSLYAVRRVHADGLPIERALDIVRPFIDGLRKSAEQTGSP
jgi:AcrR family transcriptional regulator